MTKTIKTTLIALTGAALISTAASAGNMTLPASEPMVQVPVAAPAPTGSLGSLGGSAALGILGLLVLAGVAAGSGS